MSFFCTKKFNTEAEASSHLRKRGFVESRACRGHWARVRNGIYAFVSVGQCGSGEYLITVDAPMHPLPTPQAATEAD